MRALAAGGAVLLVLAASYGMVSGKQVDALGDGHDYTFRDLNIFPVATSAVWKLVGDAPAGTDRRRRERVLPLYGTALTQLELTAVASGSSSRFVTVTARGDETTFGFVGALGLRWDATDSGPQQPRLLRLEAQHFDAIPFLRVPRLGVRVLAAAVFGGAAIFMARTERTSSGLSSP